MCSISFVLWLSVPKKPGAQPNTAARFSSIRSRSVLESCKESQLFEGACTFSLSFSCVQVRAHVRTTYVLPSCYLWCPPSNLFTFNKMSSSTQRAWYVRHSQDFPPRAHYMYEKHFHDTKSWPLCCISPGPALSATALLHRKRLKRTHGDLNFWNSRNLKLWSHIIKFLYITQLSYKRMCHNYRASAINIINRTNVRSIQKVLDISTDIRFEFVADF